MVLSRGAVRQVIDGNQRQARAAELEPVELFAKPVTVSIGEPGISVFGGVVAAPPGFKGHRVHQLMAGWWQMKATVDHDG